MWRARFTLRHDCMFAAKCVSAKVKCMSIPFNAFEKDNCSYVYHFGTVIGDNHKRFLKLLRNDTRTKYFESDGNTFFLVERRKTKETPGQYYSHELIYVKPVYMDETGYEKWDIASIRKEALTEFISHFNEINIKEIRKTKLKDIYFPRLSPDLTQNQRIIFELARNEGYYNFPKKTNLEKLAKIARLSKSTMREHLRRAESKLFSDF